MVWELKLIESNSIVKLLIILTFEREFTAEQSEQEHTQRPDISRWSRVFHFSHNLRSHVRWSSTEELDLFFVGNARRKTEVNQFDTFFGFIEQDILKFNVTMCYIALMAVVDSLDHLAPQKFGLKLRHLSVWFHLQVAVQTATIDVFHDEKDLLVAFKDFV